MYFSLSLTKVGPNVKLLAQIFVAPLVNFVILLSLNHPSMHISHLGIQMKMKELAKTFMIISNRIYPFGLHGLYDISVVNIIFQIRPHIHLWFIDVVHYIRNNI